VENQEEVLAQVKLNHANPLANKNIGDTPINWDSSSGDPTAVANAEFDGTNFTAYFENNQVGVFLTEATSDTKGSIYWDKTFDYTRNIHFSGVISAGNGDGADGTTVFFGCDNSLTSRDDATNGIAIYFSEYEGNLVQIFWDGNQIFDVYEDVGTGDFNTNFSLDDLTWRQFDIIYQYVDITNSYVTVLLNGVFICRVRVDGEWVETAGSIVGISGFCGASNNDHYCKKFQAKSANPWLLING